MNGFEVETKYAYLAGLIDGEGTIGAWRNPRGYYPPMICIEMTHEPTILWLQENFGGNVQQNDKKNSKHKTSWKWQIHATAIREHLPLTLPYMITKKAQAEIVIELLSLRKRGNAHTTSGQEELVAQLRGLNRRGQ